MIGALFLIGVLAPFAHAAHTSKLSLEEYLTAVRKHHQGFVASVSERDAASERSKEASLLLTPVLFGSAQLASDAKPNVNPSFSGERTYFNSYSLGISQQTSFGLLAKAGYLLSYTDIIGAAPTAIPQPVFHDARPSLELTQSLWRNWGGRETRAMYDAIQAQALATSFGEDFKASLTLAEAETAYWRLALARESVEVARETRERAGRIRDWNARRVKLNLTDRSDLLQAEAAVEARSLELRNALNEERSASRAFNSSRNSESDQVSEALTPVDPEAVALLAAPKRSPLRSDVRAAQEQGKAVMAQAQTAIEKNKPNFELYAILALNGHAADASPAVSQSVTLLHPTNAVGLRFSAPLDLWTSAHVRSAYARGQASAEQVVDRKLYEQEREWLDLSSRLEESRMRLGLARRLEAAQKAKLQAEKDRHQRGRSTTFQVLQFEQDFAESRLLRIRTEADILQTVSRMKTFTSGGGS